MHFFVNEGKAKSKTTQTKNHWRKTFIYTFHVSKKSHFQFFFLLFLFFFLSFQKPSFTLFKNQFYINT